MTETIKIAVCDDEKNIRSYLVSLIKKQEREFLSCVSWVRYGVLAFAIMGYAGICYKKQIGKAFFIVLAFYDFHCLGCLMATVFILNHLLDHAIEACEKLEQGKGFIHLMLKRKKQFLLLEDVFHVTVMLQQENPDKIV